MKSATIVLSLAALFVVSAPASPQLIAAKTQPIAMGHHHVNVEDVAKNVAFWESLGGKSVAFGPRQVIVFPNVIIFLREQNPTGGTNGSVVNHVGLQFPDVRSVVRRLEKNGTPIVTTEVVPDSYEVDEEGVAFNPAVGATLAFARAPNGTRVELYETKELGQPVANHHIHFYSPEFDAMKAWYVETFDAKPGQRGGMEAADIGGVNLTFSSAAEKFAGTQGRALDHIGFEVEGLQAFCEKLQANGIEFSRPYEKIDSLNIAVAFFTDPWGTYIELTEGLDSIE